MKFLFGHLEKLMSKAKKGKYKATRSSFQATLSMVFTYRINWYTASLARPTILLVWHLETFCVEFDPDPDAIEKDLFFETWKSFTKRWPLFSGSRPRIQRGNGVPSYYIFFSLGQIILNPLITPKMKWEILLYTRPALILLSRSNFTKVHEKLFKLIWADDIQLPIVLGKTYMNVFLKFQIVPTCSS